MKHLALGLLLVLGSLAYAGETVIYSFQGANDGWNPYLNGLVMDAAGNLFGTTSKGGTGTCQQGGVQVGCGTIFELSPNGKGGWTESVLHSFTQANGLPSNQVALDSSGNLYGCTVDGGAFGDGTVFELSPSSNGWTYKVLHSFHGFDGMNPLGGVAIDTAGNLYGTTYVGGSDNDGTVFQLSNLGGKWKLTTLHSFTAGNDGLAPQGTIAIDASATVYGVAPGGGKGDGVIYSVGRKNDHWTEKIIHVFSGGNDGLASQYGIFLGPDGNLYGSAPERGKLIFYQLSFSNGNWRKRNIYAFGFGSKSGLETQGGLAFDHAGNVYGTTVMGGIGGGIVFELSPASGKYFYNYTLLSSFKGSPDGRSPTGPLLNDVNGNLFGTTAIGGSNCTAPGCGTVFEIAP